MIETRFKDTEIGKIPEDWEVRQISKLYTFKQGVQCGVEKQKTTKDKGYVRFIRIIDLTQANEPPRYIKDPGCTHHVFNNDLFMVRYGTPGIIGFGYEGVIANNLFRLLPITDVVPLFMKYNFNYVYSQISELASSSTMPAINFNSLSNFKLVIPKDKEEQLHIASALSSIDNLIFALDRLIEKKKDVKQATMQQLLTGKKRLKGHTETWDYVSLGKLGYFEGHAINPSLTPDDLFTEYSMPSFDEGKKPNIAKGGEMLSSRVSINGEVLLINKLNVRQKRIWHVKECESNAVCSGEFLPYKSDKINLSLLRHILLTEKVVQDFMDMSTGTSNSQKRVRPTNVLNYEIFVPTEKKEQLEIASFLDSMDNEIFLLESKKNKYENVKQGMMQQLLTGKIRLTD